MRALLGVLLGICLLVTSTEARAGGAPGILFIRGDVNFDAEVNIIDAIVGLDHLFGMGAPPLCDDALDVNDDGALTIVDPIVLLNFLFVPGSPAIAEPYPLCGVDFDDDGLFCFFENPHCVPPTRSYVVNAPSQVGGGDDSILLIETNSLGEQSAQPFLGPAPEWNGIRFIEVLFDEIYAVQQDAGAGIDRILAIDGNGNIFDEFPLGVGEVQGLALLDFALLYVIATEDSPPRTMVLEIDAFGGNPPEVVWETPEVYEIEGLGVDFQQQIFFSGSGGGESGIFRIDAQGDFSLIVPLADPGPIQYSFYDALFHVSTPPGESIRIDQFGPNGESYGFDVIPGYVDVEIGGIGIEESSVIIPLPELDQVLVYDRWQFMVEATYGPLNGVDHPVDAGSPALIAVP